VEQKTTKVNESPVKKEVISKPPSIPGFHIPVNELKKVDELSFAVVHIGGTQYKLIKGDVVMTQKLEGADVGREILLPKVLLIGTKTWTAIGTPLLENARVHAMVEEQTYTKKTIVFKKKRRKNYVRHNTHRQPFTSLRILDIFFSPKDPIDTSQGINKEQVLSNVLAHEIPQIEREVPTMPILSATKAQLPGPYPSTLNPPSHWDQKLLKKQKLKAQKEAARILRKQAGTAQKEDNTKKTANDNQTVKNMETTQGENSNDIKIDPKKKNKNQKTVNKNVKKTEDKTNESAGEKTEE